MNMQSPLEFVLQKIRTGYGRNRIARIFKKKFPLIPINDFLSIYKEACNQRNADRLIGLLETREAALQFTINLKEVMDAAAGKLQVGIPGKKDANGKPYISLGRKPIKGNNRLCLYEGTELTVALDIAKRATVITEEKKIALKEKLPRGYNMMPSVDGKFIAFAGRNIALYEGPVEECFKAMKEDLKFKLFGGDLNDESVLQVETINNKHTRAALELILNDAIAREDYEYAAKVRDRVNKDKSH